MRTRTESGPGGTASPTPSTPRLSDSLTTVTARCVSSIPARAASIATMVASHDASAARISQPGDGAEPPPPSDVAMSVVSSPDGPSTRQRSPSTRTAVAGVSSSVAASGWSAR